LVNVSGPSPRYQVFFEPDERENLWQKKYAKIDFEAIL
jgi:hypothetical protein